MQLTRDPSISSYYVNDALYQELVDGFSDWQRDDRAIRDPSEREQFRALLEREARLLDQLRFDEWLAMYAPECIYWVPGTPEAGDPRREIAISFDDRRRMEDRIYRLRTGYAWSPECNVPEPSSTKSISSSRSYWICWQSPPASIVTSAKRATLLKFCFFSSPAPKIGL